MNQTAISILYFFTLLSGLGLLVIIVKSIIANASRFSKTDCAYTVFLLFVMVAANSPFAVYGEIWSILKVLMLTLIFIYFLIRLTDD